MLSIKLVFITLFVQFLLADLDPLVLESSMGFGLTLYLPVEIEAASRLAFSSKSVYY
jgi:hypothetical protein